MGQKFQFAPSKFGKFCVLLYFLRRVLLIFGNKKFFCRDFGSFPNRQCNFREIIAIFKIERILTFAVKNWNGDVNTGLPTAIRSKYS